ncbi:MAG: hypothetical protein OEY51_02690, partial [Cyclobacteriaceae bacterium]|nr:hypothetical protein [Cyclobacteriaceae bacterium]
MWLIIFIPFMGKGELYPAKITIPKVSKAPEIDGTPDDKSWEGSVRLTDFVVWTLDAYTKDPVTVYLGYDSKNLYIAFNNKDTGAKSLIKEVPEKRLHDTFLWGRNFNRISLSNGKVSRDFMADPKGTMADWGDGDMAWNGAWSFAAYIGETEWTSEFRIPWSDFGMEGPGLEIEWSLSLSRSFPSGESASWGGRCSFSGEMPLTLQFGQWPQPAPGDNSIRFEANYSGKRTAMVTCEIELIPFKGKPLYINQTGQGASSDMELLSRGGPLRYTYQVSVPRGIL